MPLRFRPKELLAFHNHTDTEFKNSDFKEKLKTYLESLDKRKNQNEKAIVSESLKPFLQSLGFQFIFLVCWNLKGLLNQTKRF